MKIVLFCIFLSIIGCSHNKTEWQSSGLIPHKNAGDYREIASENVFDVRKIKEFYITNGGNCIDGFDFQDDLAGKKFGSSIDYQTFPNASKLHFQAPKGIFFDTKAVLMRNISDKVQNELVSFDIAQFGHPVILRFISSVNEFLAAQGDGPVKICTKCLKQVDRTYHATYRAMSASDESLRVSTAEFNEIFLGVMRTWVCTQKPI
jgi:hypothetical protein